MKMRQRAYQIMNISRPFLRPFIAISILVTVTQSMGVIFAYYSGKYVLSVDEGDLVGLGWSLFALLLAVLGGKIFDWQLIKIHLKKIVTDMESYIFALTLERVSKFSIGQVINQSSGFKQETLQKGAAAISELVGTFFLDVIPTFSRVLMTVLVMFYINIPIGVCALASVALYVWSSIKINNSLVPRIRSNRKMETKISTWYWEVIKHIRLVISSAKEQRAVSEYVRRYKPYDEEHKSIWTTYVALLTFVREPFIAIGHIFILFLAGLYVMAGDMSKENLIATMGLVALAYSSLGGIGNMQRRLVRNFILMGKYFDLLDIVPAVMVDPYPVRLRSLKNSIVYRDVSFQYPVFKGQDDDEEAEPLTVEAPTALKNIDLCIRRGEVVALVGPSGSGKSTFVNLLQRGYDPDNGEILVDDIDLRRLDLGLWRSSIGMVEQDPKLWDETLRYNILYGIDGNHSVTEDELERIARITRIDEFYHRLGSKKFDTLIGENGIQLSGGQRQRVAIARALIKNPDILILDEATNALDPANERLVHEAIREAMAGRTGIIIAHRLSTVRRADKIVVFEKGRIVGIGTHGELMAGCGSYQELVECENHALAV